MAGPADPGPATPRMGERTVGQNPLEGPHHQVTDDLIQPWLYRVRVLNETMAAPAVVVDADALGRVGTALADPTRRRLLLSLVEGPAFPSDLADRLGLTRGNVSNHLACLRGCGLVSTLPVGRRVRYELADPRLAGALAQLASLVLVVAEAGESGEPCGPEDYDCDHDADVAAAGVSGG